MKRCNAARPWFLYILHVFLHVHSACHCCTFMLQVCCMSMLYVHCCIHPSCLDIMQIHSACQCCMSMLHVCAPCPCLHAACPYYIPVLMFLSSRCMSMPHVHVACPCFINMLHEYENEHELKKNTRMKRNIKIYNAARPCCLLMLHFRFACSFCIPLLHVRASCSCGMSMFRLHVKVHTACPSCTTFYMSILHAKAPCPYSMSSC